MFAYVVVLFSALNPARLRDFRIGLLKRLRNGAKGGKKFPSVFEIGAGTRGSPHLRPKVGCFLAFTLTVGVEGRE
jgi:hypothetical protein